MILVCGATGMFGSRVVGELVRLGQPVRAMVRNEVKARQVLGESQELAIADLDRPDTLSAALTDVAKVFLVSPMDDKIADRELAMISAAREAGVKQVIKLHGAVRHDDELSRMHDTSIAALRDSGMEWALVSPNSVIETTLLAQLPALHQMGAMLGSAADGRVGLVAADDVGRAAAAVFVRADVPVGEEFVLTGPEALTMTEVATIMTDVLGRSIAYEDMPEDVFSSILVQNGMTPEEAEIGVIAHFRAWRAGGADVVTDRYRELTGLEPVSVRQWLVDHRASFD